MKKLFCMILACVMLLSLCACGQSGEGKENAGETTLEVGFGRESISPDYSVPLQGNDYRSRWYEEVLDYCYANCIAFRSGDETVLLFALDILHMTGVNYDTIKQSVQQKTGVPVSNIFMNATHTHSGPAISYTWDGSSRYASEFTFALVGAADKAVKDLAPATIAAGYTQTEGLAFVRHYIANDGTYVGSNFGSYDSGVKEHVREADGQLGVVQFKREGDKKRDIILVNFGAHATFNGTQADKKLSADYPGAVRDYVENQTGAYCAFFTGAAGDQGGQSRIEGLSKVPDRTQYRQYAQYLGQYAIDALPNLKPVEGTAVRLINRDMTYATNKENLDKTPEEMNGPFEADWIGRRRMLPDTRTMTLRVLAVGDLGFISAPYEMFGEQGKYIKDNSPFETTVVMTCGEGDNSYVANTAGFEYNCYESQVCYYARGTAEQAAKDFVSMLEELK